MDDVKLKSVFVAHQEEIIENGRAALYFFPNGQTETAVIHLTNEDGTTTYSVIVSPLTGKSRIVPEYVEYEKINESD